jgi:hypothetical protein
VLIPILTPTELPASQAVVASRGGEVGVELFETPSGFIAYAFLGHADGELSLDVTDNSVALVSPDGRRLMHLRFSERIDAGAVSARLGPDHLEIEIPKRDRVVTASDDQVLRFFLR